MKRIIFLFFVFVLSACSTQPSEGDIQTAIAKTQEANPTNSHPEIPTYTIAQTQQATKPSAPSYGTDYRPTKMPTIVYSGEFGGVTGMRPEWFTTPISDDQICKNWSQITLNDVGRVLCVQGVVEYVSNDETSFQVRFSNDPGSFFILSREWYYPDILRGSCVMVIDGKIENLGGKTPVIVIRNDDEILVCEER